MELPLIVKDRVEFVAKYIGTNTDDWLVVKYHCALNLPKTHRSLFSHRHPTTKKQTPNDFDRAVMNYWKELTGVELKLDPAKIHDPNWIWKPVGWSLKNRKSI